MEKPVYSTEGKETGVVELSDAVFGLPVNEDLIWYAINNELANARLGTASTKDRGEVHGSNTKPYKQKGTGRARRGDKKSPLLVGGGVIFGPRPRDFSYAMPKKAKRGAFRSILSLKAQTDTLKVIEDFSVNSGKTRDMAKILAACGAEGRVVVILKDDDPLVKRAGANIPALRFLAFNRLRAHDLFYARCVLAQKTAVEKLNDFYGPASEAARRALESAPEKEAA